MVGGARGGIPLPEAMRLYEVSGYRVIPNFGFYRDDPRCVCFERTLSRKPLAATR